MSDIRETTVISNKELTQMLIKKNKIKSGFYELSVGFAFNVGGVPGPEKSLLPGLTVGINGVGLTECSADNPNAVDAKTVK